LALSPVPRGLLDAFPAARNEVPEDVPLLRKRFAAEDHELRGAGCLQDDLGARLEYDQLVLGEAAGLAFDLDLAANDVGCALDVLRADLEAGAVDQGNVGVEEIGKGAGGRTQAVQRACE